MNRAQKVAKFNLIVILGPDGKISVKYLAAMVFAGMTVVTLVQSIVTLEQYGWRNKDHE